MGLIRFLIIFAAIYYGFKLLSRIVLPFLVQYLFKRSQQNMDNHFSGNEAGASGEEGEVTVKFSPGREKGKKKDGDEGEYVDFEEVE